MIGYQLLWSGFMAGLLGFTFYRSWCWEHGEYRERDTLSGKKASKDTVVWLPADILLWLIGTIGVMEFLLRREEGLHNFSALMLDVMVLLSVYFGVLLVLLPLLRKKFSARACATLWIAPVFVFYQFYALLRTLPMPRLTVYIPRSALNVFLWVWLAGFIVVEGYYIISHRRFVRRVKENSTLITEEDILKLWQEIAEELQYRKDVALLRSPVAQTPFSMGRSDGSRRTVLPVREYTVEELTMIFRHEIHHLQRWDVNTKIFITFCRAMCWWNPLVWIATKKAAEDLELSCDEIVTEDMDEGQRKAYAELLLDSAAPQQGFTTCLSASAETLRYRLKHVVTVRHRATGTLLVMVSLFACMMCFGITSLADQRDTFTALFLPEGTEIRRVYFNDTDRDDEIYSWDEKALREALNGVTVEHLASPREYMPYEAPFLQMVLTRGNETHYIDLTDGMIKDIRMGRNTTTPLYLVKSPVDWDAIREALNIDGQ